VFEIGVATAKIFRVNPNTIKKRQAVPTSSETTPTTSEPKPRRKRREPPLKPLPTEGFCRLKQVLHVFPVSRASWYDGIRDGRYPKPIRIGKKMVAWRVEDIRRLLDVDIGDDVMASLEDEGREDRNRNRLGVSRTS